MTALAPGCTEATRRGCGAGGASGASGDASSDIDADDAARRYFPLARRAARRRALSSTRRSSTKPIYLRLEPDRMLHNFRRERRARAQGAGVRRLGVRGAVDRDPLPRPHARPLPHRRGLHVRVHGRRALRRARRLHRRRTRRVPGEDRRLAHRRFPTASRRSRTVSRARSSRACPGTRRTRCWPACAMRTCTAAADRRSRCWLKFTDWIDAATRDVPIARLPEDARPRTRRHERGVRRPVRDHGRTERTWRWRTASATWRCSIAARGRRGRARRPAREYADPQGHRLQPHRRRAVPTHDIAMRADFFWRTVVNQRSYATGGHGDVEHFFPQDGVREAPRLRQDHGDLLHAQHDAADAFVVRARPQSEVRRLLRARALQRHPRVAGSGERDDDVLPVHAAGLRAALSHALRFVLVLHGIGNRKPRAIRRDHFRARPPTTCS